VGGGGGLGGGGGGGVGVAHIAGLYCKKCRHAGITVLIETYVLLARLKERENQESDGTSVIDMGKSSLSKSPRRKLRNGQVSRMKRCFYLSQRRGKGTEPPIFREREGGKGASVQGSKGKFGRPRLVIVLVVHSRLHGKTKRDRGT